MSSYILIGFGILAVVMIAAFIIAYYEHKPGNSGMHVWGIVATAFANPLKLLAISISLLLFVGNIVLSFSQADTLHNRMVLAGWIDINIVMLDVFQVMATLATFIMPLFLLAMLDVSAVRRSDFDTRVAATYNFMPTFRIIAGVTFLVIIALQVGMFVEYVSTSIAISGSFLVFCIGSGVTAVVYSYNARGATHEEIFAFTMSLFTAAVIYALDFHWNELLTYSIPISNLDPNMDPLEFARKVTEFSISRDNRNLTTIAMIMVDLFAASIGLLTQELKNLLKILTFRVYSNTQREFNNIETQNNGAADPGTGNTGTNTNNTNSGTINPTMGHTS